MNPKNLSINDFNYELPNNRIAKYPLENRDSSKLLVYESGNITEDIYQNIVNHIPNNSLLIFNDTKVIEARLLFQKSTGGIIEIFCLQPHQQELEIINALQQRQKVKWECIIGGISKWKQDQILQKSIFINEKEIILSATFIKKINENFIIELAWNDYQFCFAEILHFFGAIPLPPYLKRKSEKIDSETYQTVYAKNDGSVASPTAGLHFTSAIFSSLSNKNINKDFVTLHVGAGTFKPVKCDKMEDHEMHAELFIVSIATIENILNNLENNIVAVGTTSLRTIESIYWIGLKIFLNQPPFNLLTQWEIYELEEKKLPMQFVLKSLIDWMKVNNLSKLVAQTQIIIAPGYHPKIVRGLITNFHQPKSTLLLLIAALIGKNWKKNYEYALQNDFRFLSYGDGNLLWFNKYKS